MARFKVIRRQHYHQEYMQHPVVPSGETPRSDVPRQLSISPHSPHYDKYWLTQIDQVFCDEEWFPDCVAYDLDEGWLINRVGGLWAPRKYGKIRVTLRRYNDSRDA